MAQKMAFLLLILETPALHIFQWQQNRSLSQLVAGGRAGGPLLRSLKMHLFLLLFVTTYSSSRRVGREAHSKIPHVPFTWGESLLSKM